MISRLLRAGAVGTLVWVGLAGCGESTKEDLMGPAPKMEDLTPEQQAEARRIADEHKQMMDKMAEEMARQGESK